MDFIENIGVCQKGAEAGFGAEVDRAPAIFGARKVLWVGVAEDTSAECDEPLRTGFDVFSRFIFAGRSRHAVILLLQCKPQMSQCAGSWGLVWYLSAQRWRRQLAVHDL